MINRPRLDPDDRPALATRQGQGGGPHPDDGTPADDVPPLAVIRSIRSPSRFLRRRARLREPHRHRAGSRWVDREPQFDRADRQHPGLDDYRARSDGRPRSGGSRRGRGRVRRSGRATLMLPGRRRGGSCLSDPDHDVASRRLRWTRLIPRPLWRVSRYSSLGVGVGDDPAADLVGDAVPFDQHRPDGDVEGGQTAPTLEVADGPGVHAPAVGLEFVDDLHRPDLGGAGDRAAGEQGADDVDRPDARD